MSQDHTQITHTQIAHSACMDILETAFPNISRIPIETGFLDDPSIKKLVNLIKFSIPVHTYQPELLALYDRISQVYYDYHFRNSLPTKEITGENNVSLQPTAEKQTSSQPINNSNMRKKINYLELAKFIESYTPEKDIYVNQEVIRQGQRFDTW